MSSPRAATFVHIKILVSPSLNSRNVALAALAALATAPHPRREHGGDVAFPHHEFGQVPAPVPGVAKYDRLGLYGKREGGGGRGGEEEVDVVCVLV